MCRLGVAFLVAFLALPLAGGRYAMEGESPWDSDHASNPQVYCMVVFDVPDVHECVVEGDVRNVEVVRVRMLGTGALVHASVVDPKATWDLPEQRAVFDCRSDCLHTILGGPWTDERWIMYVEVHAPLGSTFVQVSLEKATRLTPDRPPI